MQLPSFINFTQILKQDYIWYIFLYHNVDIMMSNVEGKKENIEL